MVVMLFAGLTITPAQVTSLRKQRCSMAAVEPSPIRRVDSAPHSSRRLPTAARRSGFLLQASKEADDEFYDQISGT
jgi:hypothetical protein